MASFLPLLVLAALIALLAYIGFQIYLYANELADRGRRKMEKKNVTFTKDGMKVGVKQRSTEDYADKTQSYLVKAWGLTSFPAYKSRLGWNKETEQGKKT
ncbi:hypothetical protein IWX90DRAFT_490084 [Phyllosticta citrichinensis]|uniref:ATP synthase F0 subunit 8 n=1 Tax=Phyllosticta citrichinensis TaxID=1130410 RepID=A0ABR1XH90_9PEZI